ncbi:MAG TPA: bifunctional nuclease family protein [Myxococcota bacterium]|nr:bifunctional nuclease family protein [Myxococcota bacterium]
MRAGLIPLLGLLAALGLSLVGCGARPDDAHDVRVRVDRVVIDDNDSPVVVLEEEGGTRWLPIWIGSAEARSIALEMESMRSPRPNTHDLARDLIRHLDAEVARAVVTELREGTYYASLLLKRGGHLLPIDARPSDAIAIALRAHAPIFVREPLFDLSHADDASDGKSPQPEI